MRKREQGFTLIEVTVALALLALILPAAYFSLGSGLKALESVRDYRQATRLLADSLEDLRSRGEEIIGQSGEQKEPFQGEYVLCYRVEPVEGLLYRCEVWICRGEEVVAEAVFLLMGGRGVES
ncbi:MAG: prepilin-type N-terminal cleavage/methylation domain-containing protein [Firmicutes bacterium]|nr:prepilin-type N-terminal cleavage/methylation domain-containing protein [Bacillota bacterium]